MRVAHAYEKATAWRDRRPVLAANAAFSIALPPVPDVPQAELSAERRREIAARCAGAGLVNHVAAPVRAALRDRTLHRDDDRPTTRHARRFRQRAGRHLHLSHRPSRGAVAMMRRLALALALLLPPVAAWAQTTPGELRLGMTAADIPTAKGAPDQGGEGIRWMGFTIYDSLLYWDLLQDKTIPDLVPALATKWYPNPADNREWIIELRHGVKFHDGSDFTADSVIWNFEKLLKPDAPQYDPEQKAALWLPHPRHPALAQDRRLHARHRRRHAERGHPAADRLSAYLEPGAVEEARRLGRVRQAPVGHRPVHSGQDHSAPGSRSAAQHELLGRAAPAAREEAGAAADPRRQHARRRPVVRPGQLHRGAAAGCHRLPEVEGHADLRQPLPAYLAVHPARRRRQHSR